MVINFLNEYTELFNIILLQEPPGSKSGPTTVTTSLAQSSSKAGPPLHPLPLLQTPQDPEHSPTSRSAWTSQSPSTQI